MLLAWRVCSLTANQIQLYIPWSNQMAWKAWRPELLYMYLACSDVMVFAVMPLICSLSRLCLISVWHQCISRLYSKAKFLTVADMLPNAWRWPLNYTIICFHIITHHLSTAMPLSHRWDSPPGSTTNIPWNMEITWNNTCGCWFHLVYPILSQLGFP